MHNKILIIVVFLSTCSTEDRNKYLNTDKWKSFLQP